MIPDRSGTPGSPCVIPDRSGRPGSPCVSPDRSGRPGSPFAIPKSFDDICALSPIQQEIFSDDEAEENRATYLAGILRSIRFGTEDAHGRANALQLNYLLSTGGIELDRKKGEFSIDAKKFDPAITALAKELLEIEGTGDYARAGALLKKNGDLDPAARDALKKIDDVPVDVSFTYPL